jgi:hypothetical protein
MHNNSVHILQTDESTRNEKLTRGEGAAAGYPTESQNCAVKGKNNWHDAALGISRLNEVVQLGFAERKGEEGGGYGRKRLLQKTLLTQTTAERRERANGNGLNRLDAAETVREVSH